MFEHAQKGCYTKTFHIAGSFSEGCRGLLLITACAFGRSYNESPGDGNSFLVQDLVLKQVNKRTYHRTWQYVDLGCMSRGITYSNAERLQHPTVRAPVNSHFKLGPCPEVQFGFGSEHVL